MAKTKLPQIGDKISADKFFVSKCNVRADLPFGESESDKLLIANLRRGKIVEPFKARPEGEGYGVYQGRRRFLAKKALGVRFFVVGKDCLIDDVTDEEAKMASWVENLRELQDDMDPITRAKGLSEVLSTSTVSLRMFARLHGFSPSTLSEWLKLLELSPRMQEVTQKRLLFFKDALDVAKLKLNTELQDQLAEILEKDGYDAFKAELKRRMVGKRKRGIPKGKYSILRITWDSRYPPDVETLNKLTKLAEANNKEVDDYCKEVLREHAKTVSP